MAILAHTYGAKSELNATTDFFPFYADIFRSERDIVFDDGRHRLIVGILEYYPYLLTDFK